MKTLNKILAVIFAITLLAVIMPVVSNASTLTINNNTPTSNSSTYEVYEILTKTETGYALTEKAASYFESNVTATVNGSTKNLTTVDEVLEYLTDLASSSSSSETTNTVTYSPATKEAFATDYRKNVTADSTSVTSPITVENGYYLIYDENGEPKSQNILVEVTENKTVNVKAVGITLEKQATNGDSHYVGETVNFEIKTVVPNMAGFDSYTFTISDNAQNLKITSGTVKVYISGEEISLDSSKITTADSTLEVVLGDYLFANKASLTVGDEIVVKYDAVVTASAISGSTATNSASLTYSNDPNTSSTNTISTPDSEKVYTYSVTFTKKSTLGKALTGAKFVLKTSTGKYIKVDDTTSAITEVEEKADATEFVGGEFTISGLKEGTYELIETEAPTGYTIVSGLIFTISNNDNSTIGTAEPQTVSHTLSEDSAYLTVTTASGLNGFAVDVINSKTTALPSTGGIGTTIFTVIGVVLMAGAIIAIVVINKKNNK
jgi:LPXTG-motif cell wall-anchored protein